MMRYPLSKMLMMFAGCLVMTTTASAQVVDNINLGTLDGTNGVKVEGIEGGAHSGFAVRGAGDINNDGFDDILIAAPRTNSYAGEVYVLFGDSDALLPFPDSIPLDGTNGFRIPGLILSPSGQLGSSVSQLGDINGDGIDDIIIESNASHFVIFGRSDGRESHNQHCCTERQTPGYPAQ